MLDPLTEGEAPLVDTLERALVRQDPLATLDAIRRLDLQLGDCDGSIARGIVSRAIRYLEHDLLEQLTGPRGRRLTLREWTALRADQGAA